MSLLDKFKSGLAKTRAGFVDELGRLVASQYEIDDEMMERVEEILIGADIGVETSLAIVEELQAIVSRKGFRSSEDLLRFLRKQLEQQLTGSVETDGDPFDFVNPGTRPFVVMVVGVNGAGKTTTIAKLAHRYAEAGKKVLLSAADTFRAAASEQLEVWAKRARVEIVKTQPGADPAAIAFDSLKAAQARGIDVVLVDTAGRLHTQVNLMEELKKIHRVLGKGISDAPHEVLLILDAGTGQNALAQAKQFRAAVNVTSVAVTKLDGTAKGGMVFAVQRELGLPVRFVGLGEGIDDLKTFDSEMFLEALFQ